MKFLIFIFLISLQGIGNQRKSQTLICVHPEDEKLGHTIQPESCRPTTGHSGILKSGHAIVDICADCQAQHTANPDQCKPTPLNCSKTRPVED